MKLNTRTLLEYRIFEGSELTNEKLHEIVEASDFSRAKERALWLLSYRDHTSGELIDKLTKDYPRDVAEKVIERMQELSLLDDERVARRYAEELHNKHHSERDIVFRLTNKGIKKEDAEAIARELSIDPVEEICALIEKKHLRNLSDEKGLRRVFSSLQRAGFRFCDIKTALLNFTDTDMDY